MTVIRPDLAEAPAELRRLLESHADRLDLELLDRALRFSATAHRGQKRISGEDFVSHSIAVAQILAEQLLDTTSIAAALLHDVVEDSEVRVEDIAREFGGEVAGIVDGLTNGRGGVMPTWHGRLDDTTIKALTLYVHSLGGDRQP